MPIDFASLGLASGTNSFVEPAKLFHALPGKAFGYLRDVQSEVLAQWHADRNNSDTLVRMNTGSGKTVVGLLMLKSSLNEGLGPAVYVCPDKYLARQVLETAQQLHINASVEEADPAFLRGESILVANTHKLFNGLSVFGVGSEGRKIPIGSVLVDDVHACLETMAEQFRLTLRGDREEYVRLVEIFAAELHQQ